MRGFAGSCRFVFNKALALKKGIYDKEKRSVSYVELAKLLTQWKSAADTAWLADAPSQPLQQTLKDLDRAYTNFFAKRADFPHFKKKGIRDSFRYPQGVKLDQPNNRLFLPKLGWVRYRNSRRAPGIIKNVTVSLSAGKWYASIQTEREVEPTIHPSLSIVGIDLGVARFATLSDGSVVEPVAFQKQRARLIRAQHSLSRKVKFSQNWKKAKAKVGRIHQKIGFIRKDHLHKASNTISKNHAIIVIEDLKVTNMSRSAAGTVGKPGRNVKAKSGLNRSILDQGWGEFRRQLTYKQQWRGGDLIAIAAMNTSRTCPECGHLSKDNRKTQAKFACVACGHADHADLVAACNILAAGHAVLACGETGPFARSMKQEPSEAITQELAYV